jgi:hypothetical protein
MSITKKALLTAGAAIALATGLSGGQAQAVPSLPGACTHTLTFTNGNTGSLPISDITGGNCVLAQDKLIGNFVNGTTHPLPGGADVQASLNHLNGQDFHLIGISDSFVSGNTYTFSFEVFDEGFPTHPITELDGDFTQTAGGPSTLTKTTVPPGTGTIDLVKNGVSASGPHQIFYNPGVQDLQISEKLVDNGTINAIDNTVIEGFPVPEPASLGLLGLGLVGLGVMRRRIKKE